MDIFDQNWTQKMKTEPFVNYLLNSDQVTEDYVTTWWHIPKKLVKRKDRLRKHMKHRGKTYYKYEMPLNKAARKNLEKHPERVLKVAGQMLVDYWQKESGLHDNTRPQSLYNLHYASLR